MKCCEYDSCIVKLLIVVIMYRSKLEPVQKSITFTLVEYFRASLGAYLWSEVPYGAPLGLALALPKTIVSGV